MYLTAAQRAIATTSPNCDRMVNQVAAQSELERYLESQVQAIAPEPVKIRTPQRRANLCDKARFQRDRLKEIAFFECGWNSTALVKKYLQVLGIKLDLRLTSAWVALVFELKPQIDAVKAIVDALEPIEPQIKVGDRVVWDYPYGWSHLEAWFPLEVMAIEGDKAHLEMMAIPVPIFELSRQK